MPQLSWLFVQAMSPELQCLLGAQHSPCRVEFFAPAAFALVHSNPEPSGLASQRYHSRSIPRTTQASFSKVAPRRSCSGEMRCRLGQALRRSRRPRQVTKTAWEPIPLASRLTAVFRLVVGREMHQPNTGGIIRISNVAVIDGGGALQRPRCAEVEALKYHLRRASIRDGPKASHGCISYTCNRTLLSLKSKLST